MIIWMIKEYLNYPFEFNIVYKDTLFLRNSYTKGVDTYSLTQI